MYRAVINDTFEAQFEYYDLTAEVTPLDVPTLNSLEQFCTDHKNAVLESDPDAGGGTYNIHQGLKIKYDYDSE